MSVVCSRFAVGGLFTLSLPIQHHLPFAEVGNVHQNLLSLNDQQMRKEKNIDPLLAMYIARRHNTLQELGGEIVLVEQDSFSKAYLHGCYVVSFDFTDGIVYENNKSPNIKMKKGSYSISSGHFWVLHLKPHTIQIKRTTTIYTQVPSLTVDLSGAECFICSHPYNNTDRRKIQVCALPCTEGFICSDCFKCYNDKTKCPICRQASNPLINTLLNPPINKLIGAYSLAGSTPPELCGWLGRAFSAESNFKLCLGVSLIRRSLINLNPVSFYTDLNDVINSDDMMTSFKENIGEIITYGDFYAYGPGSNSDLLESIKALVPTEDARLKLLQDCNDNSTIRKNTFCSGYLKRLSAMNDGELANTMQKLKEMVFDAINLMFRHSAQYIQRQENTIYVQV